MKYFIKYFYLSYIYYKNIFSYDGISREYKKVDNNIINTHFSTPS